MQVAVTSKLQHLNANHAGVIGRPFVHFLCPVLFRDEETELWKAHIVNVAFRGRRPWTVQRKDVRLSSLVSALKAAHLTMFEMVGYYALTLARARSGGL